MAQADEKKERFLEQARNTVASFSQAATRDGTIPAMGREAVKDIRNTLHQVFFGQNEGQSEPGAPLNPTQGEIAADRRDPDGQHGSEQQPEKPMRSPAAIAKDRTAPRDRSWVQRVMDRERPGQEDANNEQGQGRSLPQEERQREQDRGDRGR